MKILKPAGGVFLVLVLVPAFAAWVFAGELEPPAGPDDPGSATYTLEDAYNRLDVGDAGEKRTGGFTAPSSIPGSTGQTIDEMMTKMPAADVIDGAAPEEVAAGKTYWSLRTDGTWGQQTGSSTVCDNSCTGSLSAGGRWCDQDDGTVKDMTTGLVWLQNAAWGYLYPYWTETSAGTNAHDRASQVRDGSPVFLADGSVEGDWRLPTKNELYGLANGAEAIRSDTDSMGPFFSVQPGGYWTCTNFPLIPTYGWWVDMRDGSADISYNKWAEMRVWPVRGGN